MKQLGMCAGLFAAGLLALAQRGGSQASPPPQQPQEPSSQEPGIRREVGLVNIFATVRNKNKRIVTGLKKEDFKILEDNTEQKIAFFSAESALPITIGMLIDTSGSEEHMIGAIQDGGSRFLSRVMRKGDEAMVISFDLDVDLLSDFTDDRSQLERAIRRTRINTAGGNVAVTPGPLPTSTAPNGTHLYDAIYLACADKLASEAGRKAIVILTDAEDVGSKLRLEEAIEAAQRTDTVVHVLLIHERGGFGFGGGWRPDVAKKITDETGGRMIDVTSEKRLEEAFDQISEELRNEYTLGYYASRDGKFHKIKVETVNKDLKVMARKGYYAPKS